MFKSERNITHTKRLSDADHETLEHLFTAVSPQTLREDLIELYHSYLIHTRGNLPTSFDRISRSMYHVIHCLGELRD